MDTPSSDLPFGDPDAVRSNPRASLIEIDGAYQSPLSNPSAMSERIVVGRKGSGKTLYLRAHQVAAANRGFIVLENTEKLATTTLISILNNARHYLERMQRFEIGFTTSTSSIPIRFWTMLWERSIILSVASMFYATNPIAKRPERAMGQSEFQNYFAPIYNAPISPLPPTSFLSRISTSLRGAKQWGDYLEHNLWAEMKSIVSTFLHDAPEVSCYIDCIDDEFDQAPSLWAECQNGLFFSVFQSLYEREIFNKLHFVVAIRDVVFSSILRSEHATRYITNSHIRHLTWDQVTTRRFLIEKIGRLGPQHLSHDQGKSLDPFQRWLGIAHIKNEKRQIVEPVSDYILRHSRMLPRDIVVLGNSISAERTRRRLQDKPFEGASLRKAVNYSAAQFASESIEICLNEAMMNIEYFAGLLQEAKLEEQESDNYTPSRQLVSSLKESARCQLNKMVDLLGGKEQFSYTELQESMIASGLIGSRSLFIDDVDLPFRLDNILWRHGMLAVLDDQTRGGRWRYSWRSSNESLILPRGGIRYGFHASLVTHYRLKVGNENPVY
jgi:hypothetical protein